MRRARTGFLMLLALVLAGTAFAQGPGSYLRRTGTFGGPIVLHANFVASDNCQAALATRRGAPSGQSVGAGVVPVTITIGPNPRGCGDSPLVRAIMNVSDPRPLFTVQIFFVNPAGRVLKIERVGG